MACLDTTLLVDLLRSNPKRKREAIEKIEILVKSRETIVTTRMNLAELYVGVELSDDPERDYEQVRGILDYVSVILELDDSAAQAFGQTTAHLRRLGRPAGDLDVLIAATALAHGHCLVTRNPAHFADIPHLVVECY
jgi:predicted nucleic acid-binding protein